MRRGVFRTNHSTILTEEIACQTSLGNITTPSASAPGLWEQCDDMIVSDGYALYDANGQAFIISLARYVQSRLDVTRVDLAVDTFAPSVLSSTLR